ncbi:MAG: V4R domain-containing protein [Planctomycetota bacterium]
MAIDTVKVPPEMEPLFIRAQEYVSKYFAKRVEDPTKGEISISGERYILVRAASMSVEFLDFIQSIYPGLEKSESEKAAASILFDIAHAIGKADAAAFHKATNVTDPIAKLSTGPIHFAYTGWAYVDIFPESKPSPDENYYLIYDHPQSFEADSWIKKNAELAKAQGKEKIFTNFPVCFMNAGYSSGWCEESFGVPLTAKEISCRAMGDPYCRFIMAHPNKIDNYIASYKEKHPELFKRESK